MRDRGRGWPRAAGAALLLALLLVGLAGQPGPAGAADPGLRLKTMQVDVWPEYDEPRIAVMYEGEFAGADFPRQVRFYLPKGAEVGEVCALKKPDDEHLCQLYDLTQEGEQLVLTYTLPLPTFYIQFYYGSLGSSTQRSVDFALKAPYAVDSLTFDVQQPLRSESFTTTPPALVSSVDSQGFRYHRLTYQSVGAGEVISARASYSKADANPSVAKRQTGAAAGGAGAPLVSYAPVVVLGVGLLVVAVFLLARRAGRPEPLPASAPRRPPQPVAPPAAAEPRPRSGPPSGRFCTGCGEELEPEDAFCPKCGRRARRIVAPTGGRR